MASMIQLQTPLMAAPRPRTATTLWVSPTALVAFANDAVKGGAGRPRGVPR